MRDSFVFYRSYLEAIETLSKKNKLIGFHSFIYSRNTLFPSNIKMNK